MLLLCKDLPVCRRTVSEGNVWFGDLSGCALAGSPSQFVRAVQPEGSRQTPDSLRAGAD